MSMLDDLNDLQDKYDNLLRKYKKLKTLSKPSVVSEPRIANNKESNEFWKDIIYKNGKIDEEQVLKELADYYFVMQEVPKVYCHITGGKLSYITYPASTIISVADDLISEQYVDKDDLKSLME